MRAGSQFQGGGHGLEVRKEGNEQYLYVCISKRYELLQSSLSKEKLFGEICSDGQWCLPNKRRYKRIKRWGVMPSYQQILLFLMMEDSPQMDTEFCIHLRQSR